MCLQSIGRRPASAKVTRWLHGSTTRTRAASRSLPQFVSELSEEFEPTPKPITTAGSAASTSASAARSATSTRTLRRIQTYRCTCADCDTFATKKHEAVGQFRQALQLKPDWIPAVASLAWLLATAPDAALRDANEAIRFAEQAADLTGRQDASALDILAAAYAAAGQFDRAVAASQAALGMKPDAALAAAILRRQELYRQHKAYVSSVGPSGM